MTRICVVNLLNAFGTIVGHFLAVITVTGKNSVKIYLGFSLKF